MTDRAGLEALAEAVEKAASATNEQIVAWAYGPENNGPFSQETFRNYVHMQAAMRIFASHLATALRARANQQEPNND